MSGDSEQDGNAVLNKTPAIYLFGCCSYEDVWQPGIKGWGRTDAESRLSGYVSVEDYDRLLAFAKDLSIRLKNAAIF